jgi:hypothetical protein
VSIRDRLGDISVDQCSPTAFDFLSIVNSFSSGGSRDGTSVYVGGKRRGLAR